MFNMAVQPEKIVDCSMQNDVYCYRVCWCDSWVPHDTFPDSWQHLVDTFWKKQTEETIQQQDETNRFFHSLNTKLLPNFSTLLVGDSQQQNLISSQTPTDNLGSLAASQTLFPTTQHISNFSTQQATFTLTTGGLRDNQLDISSVADFQIPLFEQTSQPTLQLIQPTQHGEISSISNINADEQTETTETTETVNKTDQQLIKEERTKKEKKKKVTTPAGSATRTNTDKTTCDECSRDFSKTSNPRKRLREHVRRVHLKNGKFHCANCPKTFVCKQGLRDHEPVHSKERNHSCSYCGQTFLRSSHLYMHTRTHEEEKNFQCEGCVFTCNVQSELKEHCENTHSDITIDIKCSVCKQNLFSSQSIYSHSLRHSGSRDWKCDVCGSAFKRKQILDQHMKRHSKDRNMFSCENCNKDFTTRSTLKHHMYIVHNLTMDDAEYKCDVCGKSFKNWANYNRHIGLHPKVNDNTSTNTVGEQCNNDGAITKDWSLLSSDDLTCNVCKVHHESLTELLKHLQQHQSDDTEGRNCVYNASKDQNNEKKCGTCKKSFKSENNLKKHLDIHGTLELKCDICYVVFKRRDTLRVHKKRHLQRNEKPEDFDEAKDSSVNNRLKELHAQIGQPDENGNISCPYCGKDFNKRKLLLSHIVIHSDISFTCDTCGKAYKQRSCLTKHMRSHQPGVSSKRGRPAGQVKTQLKGKYKCDTCHFECSSIKLLKEHKASHKPFRVDCKDCNLVFIRQDEFQVHIRQVHANKRGHPLQNPVEIETDSTEVDTEVVQAENLVDSFIEAMAN